MRLKEIEWILKARNKKKVEWNKEEKKELDEWMRLKTGRKSRE